MVKKIKILLNYIFELKELKESTLSNIEITYINSLKILSEKLSENNNLDILLNINGLLRTIIIDSTNKQLKDLSNIVIWSFDLNNLEYDSLPSYLYYKNKEYGF